MREEELVDIKFRLYDGSDMGPFQYSSASTIDMLKQRVVSDWPKGKTIIPKEASEVKLISAGKVLENTKTVGQCKMPFGDVGGGDTIMHVVVQSSLAKKRAEKKLDDSPRKVVCSCSVL
ncbi:membrane-anchored ubiquitin-fold protein 3 isoform X2 [Rhodamnia argentea]|uniref:Membrane-anchored ubiquitin-fold protein n=1 Tax=Rhodamnia argentea TaxID=178133 RepID=A0A8B8Q763_9MYRT|nr:membrane-anchored ubiquitin-fold protein 3 isoform X2 [Rhodamnia argentea]